MSTDTAHRTSSHDDDRGATAVEYSIIVALVASVILVVVTLLGLDTLGLFQQVDWT